MRRPQRGVPKESLSKRSEGESLPMEISEKYDLQNPTLISGIHSYRLFNYSSPALGVHMGLRLPGKVKANDVVYVEDK